MKKTKFLALVGLAACVAATSASAKEWKTVRFGTKATYAPFKSVEPTGKIIGFEIDNGKALCEKMKVTCTFRTQGLGRHHPVAPRRQVRCDLLEHEHHR